MSKLLSYSTVRLFSKFCLEKNISDLMIFYRPNWPTQSVTPKMHLLEYHAVPFIRKWGSGFGLYGEQGVESLHAVFNSLKISYQAMKSPTERLLAMMKEHYSRVNPDSLKYKEALVPITKKRKLAT